MNTIINKIIQKQNNYKKSHKNRSNRVNIQTVIDKY
jgi:hypothetical protein